MKYIIGSFIISFGILFVALGVLMSLVEQAPKHTMEYVGLVWVLLTVVSYPLAKKIVRD